jgi:hypothetical protein
MLGSAGIGGDERQINVVLLRAGKSDLGLLRLLLDPLQSVGLLAQIHPLLLFKFVEDPVHEGIVPIVTPEMGVAIGGFDFENAVADFQHGDVKGPPSQIVNRNFFVLLFVEPVGQGGGGRLIDNPQNFQSGNASGILGGLAL